MANGIKALRTIQISQESPAGSPGGLRTWRGLGTMKDTREVLFPAEDTGNMAGYDRTYTPKLGGEFTFESSEATFEQIHLMLDAGLHYAAPTTDTGSGHIRTYTLPTTSQYQTSDLKTLSILGGDNNDVDVGHYGFLREFTLSGSASAAWMFSGVVETQEVGSTDFGTASIPVVETMLFGKTTLYIDATSTDFGTTPVSNTLLSAELSVTTGWQSVFANDGLDFSFIKQTMPEILLNLTYEHNTTAATEKTAWREETPRLIRLKIEGTALTSAGTYTYKTLIIDLAGKYESFDALEEQDGNDIVTCLFRGRYNATSGKFCTMTLVNEIS